MHGSILVHHIKSIEACSSEVPIGKKIKNKQIKRFLWFYWILAMLLHQILMWERKRNEHLVFGHPASPWNKTLAVVCCASKRPTSPFIFLLGIWEDIYIIACVCVYVWVAQKINRCCCVLLLSAGLCSKEPSENGPRGERHPQKKTIKKKGSAVTSQENRSICSLHRLSTCFRVLFYKHLCLSQEIAAIFHLCFNAFSTIFSLKRSNQTSQSCSERWLR